MSGAPTCRWEGLPSRARSIPRSNAWLWLPHCAIGAEMAGVDLIFDLDRERLIVLEINAVPGLARAGEGDRH